CLDSTRSGLRRKLLSAVKGGQSFELGDFGFQLADAGGEVGDGDVFLAVAAGKLFDFDFQRRVFLPFEVKLGFQTGDALRPLLEVVVGALEDGVDDIHVVGAFFEAVTEEVAEEAAKEPRDECDEDGFGLDWMRWGDSAGLSAVGKDM